MANPEHEDLLRKSVTEWNAWREEHPEVWPDLNGAHLREAYLRGADLGQVVGHSLISPGVRHAFVYSNGVMTDIEALVECLKSL
jgi:probable HAF family extracellular repeat protein